MTRLLSLLVLCLSGCAASQTGNQPIHQKSPESASLPTKPRAESKLSNVLSYREVSLPGITVELSAARGGCRDARAFALASISQISTAISKRSRERITSLSGCRPGSLYFYARYSACRQLYDNWSFVAARKALELTSLFEVAEVTEPPSGTGTTLGNVGRTSSRLGRSGNERQLKRECFFGLSVYLSSPRTVAVLTRQESPYDLAQPDG